MNKNYNLDFTKHFIPNNCTVMISANVRNFCC